MREKRQSESFFWLIRGIIVLLALTVFLFGYAFSKELKKKKKIREEILSLQEEAQKVERENMEIKKRISYLGSKDFQEIEAKERLNLQNPGEKMVVISPSPISKDEKEAVYSSEKDKPIIEESPKDYRNNFQKWWDYFFK
ncbi:MAG: hypothetical protein COZ85_03255 [Candidatus Moranbacteria bacterium CG_4_8_14_3_um_filter_34_16]|nr:MAG: hypothetical protein COT31_04250 [Candidatus Moranbacteria bacterium CG08_land_8_20_14_0_20_34_16]PIW94798.1 MAG: hypothetical protein COZ85_03255 [Candidatus Moranbacteria bacterium CG_4_8_14_3_um_filter_34_16]PJA89277.1 MAG: hypothetical protein CO138_01325 [Candidatus Moranbacteria bacterium CG_4_9_14_3_um_filter_33_15]